jgi:hypothetical protein
LLAALIDETTTDPLQGPATEELQGRHLSSTDRPHLLAASYRESRPGPEAFGVQHQLAPPPCPWLDRETAVQRDQEVAAEDWEQSWRELPPHRVVGPGRAS